jgi:hypothetical protein
LPVTDIESAAELFIVEEALVADVAQAGGLLECQGLAVAAAGRVKVRLPQPRLHLEVPHG